MNFKLIVPIFVFAITAINVVGADWESSFGQIGLHFTNFIRAYRQACLDQNVNVFSSNDPGLVWTRRINSQTFLEQAPTVIDSITATFKILKSAEGVNSVKIAMGALCTGINSSADIDDEFKHGQIPLREHLKQKVYIEGLGEKADDFEKDCPPQEPKA